MHILCTFSFSSNCTKPHIICSLLKYISAELEVENTTKEQFKAGKCLAYEVVS